MSGDEPEDEGRSVVWIILAVAALSIGTQIRWTAEGPKNPAPVVRPDDRPPVPASRKRR